MRVDNKRPLEVSYFVNNVCNLKCKYCYVGYEEKTGDLEVDKWKEIFNNFISLGALTFGNVGKEPLLSWNTTKELFLYFNNKKKENNLIRYGMVTNGTLLNDTIIKELAEIQPDYIDVSLDGIDEVHNYIRGEGNFQKTITNLEKIKVLYPELFLKIFISFTLMGSNKHHIFEFIRYLADKGLKQILISPYTTIKKNDELAMGLEETINIYKEIINSNKLKDISNLKIYLKSDYESQKELQEKLVENKIIDLNNLYIDDYSVIFNKYKLSPSSEVIINYIPYNETLNRAFRISHNGYLSGCIDMFYKDYEQKAALNLKKYKMEVE